MLVGKESFCVPSKPADLVNVIAELERCGCKFDWAGSAELKVRCPFHDDDKSSCTVNVEKRVFKCHAAGCGKGGDFLTFLAGLLKTSRAVVFADLAKRYNFDTTPPIESSVVERMHEAIWRAEPLLAELHKRAVTDDMIRRYRWGEDDGRITIPIKNEHGAFVNIRKYLPGAPGDQKMRNSKGRSRIRLYPIEQLAYDRIVVCGGEAKVIVAADQLNPHGWGAVTATAGEGNWAPELTKQLEGKAQLIVCMDVDKGGRDASRDMCARLYQASTWVGEVVLPLDTELHPHGDINDFVAAGGDLWPLIESCEQWRPVYEHKWNGDAPVDKELIDATHADSAGVRMRVRAVVSAVDNAPFVVPRETKVLCTKDQTECMFCPVFLHQRDTWDVAPENPAILDMIAAPRSVQREALMRGIGVPSTCKVVMFEPTAFYNVEDARVSPRLEITNRSRDRVMQPAVCIGGGVDLNETYDLVGRMFPHPRTQQSTLLISEYMPTQDALSTYVVRDPERFSVFQPEEWSVSGLQARLDALYQDLEANVTRIFQRRDMHLVVDLAYHSPLLLTFDGATVKGWVEVLIIGDSAQGKSETAINLMQHYELGEKLECKNATVAGLLGGLQNINGRWFVTWGVIPTHDKRLVILEELKGASPEVIAKLTDMRSSGVAEIPKIEKRRTHARTRLIALSNPRSSHPIRSYNFGVEAVKELIGSLEDVRRFDMVHVLSSADVDHLVINQLQQSRPQVERRCTGELCRGLVLFAWTRRAEQVQFEADTIKTTLKQATELCDEFTEEVPIVDRGSMRYKLARLAAALAVRTFSVDDTYETVLVRPCHVEYITEFLRRTYSSNAFGYKRFTDAVKSNDTVVDPDEVKRRINESSFPKTLVEKMLNTNYVDVGDLQDWCAYDSRDSRELLSFFVRKHALSRSGRAYRKTANFIELLKDMQASGQVQERPLLAGDY